MADFNATFLNNNEIYQKPTTNATFLCLIMAAAQMDDDGI